MCRMPDLQVKSTSTKKNYDDNPLIDGQCNKIYPSVSYGGYGIHVYMVLSHSWHTYGFHLIDGGEGRKDPFTLLFKFKEEMPEHIFYDFVLGLSEYALNRHHPCLPTQDSGMICFILWAMYVEITSNHIMLKDLRV